MPNDIEWKFKEDAVSDGRIKFSLFNAYSADEPELFGEDIEDRLTELYYIALNGKADEALFPAKTFHYQTRYNKTQVETELNKAARLRACALDGIREAFSNADLAPFLLTGPVFQVLDNTNSKRFRSLLDLISGRGDLGMLREIDKAVYKSTQQVMRKLTDNIEYGQSAVGFDSVPSLDIFREAQQCALANGHTDVAEWLGQKYGEAEIVHPWILSFLFYGEYDLTPWLHALFGGPDVTFSTDLIEGRATDGCGHRDLARNLLHAAYRTWPEKSIDWLESKLGGAQKALDYFNASDLERLLEDVMVTNRGEKLMSDDDTRARLRFLIGKIKNAYEGSLPVNTLTLLNTAFYRRPVAANIWIDQLSEKDTASFKSEQLYDKEVPTRLMRDFIKGVAMLDENFDWYWGLFDESERHYILRQDHYEAFYLAASIGNLPWVMRFWEDCHVDVRQAMLREAEAISEDFDAIWMSYDNGHLSVTAFLLSVASDRALADIEAQYPSIKLSFSEAFAPRCQIDEAVPSVETPQVLMESPVILVGAHLAAEDMSQHSDDVDDDEIEAALKGTIIDESDLMSPLVQENKADAIGTLHDVHVDDESLINSTVAYAEALARIRSPLLQSIRSYRPQFFAGITDAGAVEEQKSPAVEMADVNTVKGTFSPDSLSPASPGLAVFDGLRLSSGSSSDFDFDIGSDNEYESVTNAR